MKCDFTLSDIEGSYLRYMNNWAGMPPTLYLTLYLSNDNIIRYNVRSSKQKGEEIIKNYKLDGISSITGFYNDFMIHKDVYIKEHFIKQRKLKIKGDFKK